jgi:hypothetical protein
MHLPLRRKRPPARHQTDSLIIRNRVFEAECRLVLGGVRSEEELTRAMAEQFGFPGSSHQ